MDSRVTFKEMLAACLVITAFTVTGIMIMNENYQCALVALCAAAFFVLLLFLALVAGDADKILDMSNPSLRNPRKSGTSKRKVTYVDRLTPDMSFGGSMTKVSKKNFPKPGRKAEDSDNFRTEDMGGDFYESVGNMRVYKRGEEIEMNNEDDD